MAWHDDSCDSLTTLNRGPCDCGVPEKVKRMLEISDSENFSPGEFYELGQLLEGAL